MGMSFCCDKQEGGFRDGHPWFGPPHDGPCNTYEVYCQYCGLVVGLTGFKWAVESICRVCAGL